MRAKSEQSDTPPATPASPAAAPAVAATKTGTAPRASIRLQQKTTLILVIMLATIVTSIGGILLYSTRAMLKTAQVSQVSTFAYGMAATIGKWSPNDDMLQIEFTGLDKTPSLEYVVLTDIQGRQSAALISDHTSWNAYRQLLNRTSSQVSTSLGQVREVTHNKGAKTSYAVTVPVFQVTRDGGPAGISGFLHASFSTDATAAQLRFLQAFVLFTCMGFVMLAIPVAGLISRHITVPIQRLARGAHALADGDLSHRVEIKRSDELGELTEAFNRMADTVQQQQADIKRINSGLEQKVLERTAELENLNRRLHAEISEKEDFLRAVSHDLNAPLRNIAGMASMLAIKYADTLEKDALQRLERIQKNVQVECELINELLELSRIKTRREKIDRVDLHELVSAVVDGFQNDMETRKIAIRMMSHMPVMQCEKMRMRQVFQNLIDNAIKYMRDDGPREIRLSVRRERLEMLFSVEDTGMGIAAEDLPQLFHVFRRAKNASVMKVPGKGVGLASVKSIIENYNGRLWVESVQGQGTTFCFAIPLSHFEIKDEVAV